MPIASIGFAIGKFGRLFRRKKANHTIGLSKRDRISFNELKGRFRQSVDV
jgi:hypothetical protein